MENVIISSPSQEWGKEILSELQKVNVIGEQALNGKDCQLKMYHNQYSACVLDISTKNYSAFEVLRYIKLNFTGTNVILVFSSKKEFTELDFSKSDLKKLGVNDILIKPFKIQKVIESIRGACQFSLWKNNAHSQNNNEGENQEIKESDSKFTRLPISKLEMGGRSIFDLYIRINRNKYLKIFRCGDAFDRARLKKNERRARH